MEQVHFASETAENLGAKWGTRAKGVLFINNITYIIIYNVTYIKPIRASSPIPFKSQVHQDLEHRY